ncbi:MAG: hypothetical protein Q9157_002442 [Trypethelium eluteriae]
MSKRPNEDEQQTERSMSALCLTDEGEKASSDIKAQALSNDHFTVGWICALEIEVIAALEMLDKRYIDFTPKTNESDWNSYRCGRIRDHMLIIASPPQYGPIQAAQCATHMVHAFPHIRTVLMVGIGGGIPSMAHDIRLGDVIVSTPQGTSPSVIQYDLGKQRGEEFVPTGSLNRPPSFLLAAAKSLAVDHTMGKGRLANILCQMLEKNDNTRQNFPVPDPESDELYADDFPHVGLTSSNCVLCKAKPTSRIVPRNGIRTSPAIHHGVIASGSLVVKDTSTRERIRKQHNALCLEMEAAGLMTDFPCIVIRGVSDYADSHKNDRWQPYASATAAAYAKELLLKLGNYQVAEEPTVKDLLKEIDKGKDWSWFWHQPNIRIFD